MTIEGVKIHIKPDSAVLIAEGTLEQIEEIQDDFNGIISFNRSKLKTACFRV